MKLYRRYDLRQIAEDETCPDGSTCAKSAQKVRWRPECRVRVRWDVPSAIVEIYEYVNMHAFVAVRSLSECR